MQDRLDRAPKSMRVRRATVEQPFGTLKAWMGATHFKTRTLEMVRTEMSLHVLAYNLKRVIAILGAQPLMEPCGPEAAPQKRMLLSKSVEIRQPCLASSGIGSARLQVSCSPCLADLYAAPIKAAGADFAA